MIESKQEFNSLLDRLRGLCKKNILSKHLKSKLEAFEEVEHLINLPINDVVFNEADRSKDTWVQLRDFDLNNKHSITLASEVELCQCDELANINDSLIGEETCIKCNKLIDRHN